MRFSPTPGGIVRGTVANDLGGRMKTSTKLRLARKGAGGVLATTYRTGKLVGGTQHELTGGRHPIFVWAPLLGSFAAGFSAAYLLDPESGRRRRAALRAKLAASGEPTPTSPNGAPQDPAFTREGTVEVFPA